MSVMSIKGLPTISTVNAGAACSAKVQEMLSVLRRTGLDATDEVYGLLAALTARFASMVGDPSPENNMWHAGPQTYVADAEPAVQTYNADPLADVFTDAEVIDRTDAAGTTGATAAEPQNDITVQNEFVLGLLALHPRMTGKALREKGASKETLLRLEGMGLIESTGKGRASGWRLKTVDHDMPALLAPHDAHVDAYNANESKSAVKAAAVKAPAPVTPDARTLENWTVADLLAELNARAASVKEFAHKKRVAVALNTLSELLAK